MTATATLIDANAIVDNRADITAAFGSPEALLVLHFLFLRKTSTIQDLAGQLAFSQHRAKSIIDKLSDSGLVVRDGGGYRLSEPAQRRLSHRTVSLDFLVGSELRASEGLENRLKHSYRLKEVIGRGATSFTFLAEQEKTHRDRTLKIFIPGTVTYEALERAVGKRAQAITEDGAIPDVWEFGNADITLPGGQNVILPCIVFRYIAGAVTFADFLKQPFALNSAIFEKFVERVGGALASIEAAGLQHGDLHEGNILVVSGASPTQVKEFWVIDFIGVPSVTSAGLETPSDIENFRDHLVQASLVAIRRHPGVPARVILGDKVFRILEGLRRGKYRNFKEILADYSRHRPDLPADHFRPPLNDPFHGLRVEALDDPRMLYELFVPVPSRFDLLNRFGNTWISGPRGCGKSHYIRVLEFNPFVICEARHDVALQSKSARAQV